MKTYLRHKILNVVDVKGLTALEYLDFEGKYKQYVEKHNFWEICYVEKGDIELFTEKEKNVLSAGDIFIIPPKKTHSYYSENGNKSRAFVICFECASQPLKSLGGLCFMADTGILRCLQNIISEYKNTYNTKENDVLEVLEFPNFGGEQAITLQLEYLLICLLRLLSGKKNSDVVFLNDESFYADLTEIIIDYFKENITRKVSLEELCKKVGYSRSFLCKTFKEQTGETLFSYFNKLKIEEAKRLLSETSLTVSAVSVKLGFSEVKYFGAMFKKIAGVPPSAYKK